MKFDPSNDMAKPSALPVLCSDSALPVKCAEPGTSKTACVRGFRTFHNPSPMPSPNAPLRWMPQNSSARWATIGFRCVEKSSL